MGGTPLSELYIVNREGAGTAEADEINAVRTLVGNYVTSLEMPGASLTLLRLPDDVRTV